MNRLLSTLILLFLIALPAIIGGSYYTNLSSQILIAAIFAMSLNLLVGYAGLTSLGHAGYLGLAAYISGWLMVKLGWSHASSAALAIVSTTLIAGIFGLIALRATGISFLMITLAFGQILWGLAYRWASVTGGDNGISGLTRPSPFNIDLGEANNFYYFTLIIFLLIWAAITVFIRSPFGATIRGTKDQPRRMSALGFNVWFIRWVAFTTCGFFASIGGILYVYYHQFISPHSLSLANSAEMLLMVIAGGAGTLAGPVIGAALVMLLKNVASQYIDHWVTLLGLVFILIVMFIPGGIMAGLERIKNSLISSK